ncbi:MAG: gliding motility-associated C-terminal domain-containing protein [Flavobacteriales bacterium]
MRTHLPLLSPNVTRIPILALLGVLVVATTAAQSFVNGDLEGVSGTSVTPPGWTNVPYGDPVCEADAEYAATPDLTDVNGPVYSNGIMGNPYSGSTFECGLYGAGYHEGLMQSVSGFVPGQSYTIGLHQTVVKQSSTDYLDETGTWSVYMDNTLIGTTTPTFSAEPPISLNKPWDLRFVTFTATATTHWIKFLPDDDDADQMPPNGVRMGIDCIFLLGGNTDITSGAFLGNDTSFCVGGSVLLETGLPGQMHVWQDGSTGESLLVTVSGDYWVEVELECGAARDTITVSVVDPVTVDLGEDVVTCTGNIFTLNVDVPGAAQYEWQDGATTPGYTISASGQYWVEITNACGSVSDTINVTFLPAPDVDLGPDIVACSNAPVILDATFDDATVVWQDGSTANTYTVTEPGTYWVDATTGCGTISDTIAVSFVDPLVVDLQGSLSCDGTPVVLTGPPNADTYLWQDNSTGMTFTVLVPGMYSLDAGNACGVVSDMIEMLLPSPPAVNLGADVVLCPGSSATLNATLPNATYVWQDGSTNATFTTDLPGTYWVDVLVNGCFGTDTVDVSVDDCTVILEIPNVFTPNGSGDNDLFTPMERKGITSMRTQIFGRWGNLLFSTTDLDISWNGKGPNGDLAPDGTYFWVLEYTTVTGDRISLTGTLALLR